MLCPSCGQRKARRACPALGESICAICCGTKRLIEIRCPSTCVYLASARLHPAAVVRRQQERDVAMLLPTIQRLSERQHQLFFVLHTLIGRFQPEGFTRLVDDDVMEAAGALASTLETASRGVIYEHVPQSRAAQHLIDALKKMLADMRQHGATVYDGEVAIVLRAIEEGAREAQKRHEGDSAYLALLSRLLQRQAGPDGAGQEPGPAPSLVIP